MQGFLSQQTDLDQQILSESRLQSDCICTFWRGYTLFDALLSICLEVQIIIKDVR